MSKYTGKDLHLKWNSTELQGEFKTLTVSEETDFADVTAGNDEARDYLATIKDGKAEAEIFDQAGNTLLWNAIEPGTSGTLEWGPEGNATGKPKYSALAIVKSREREIPFDDGVVITIQWQFTGPVTESTY